MPRPSAIPRLERDHNKSIRDIVFDTLVKADGSPCRAAAMLGVPAPTFCYWMQKYNVRRQILVA